MTDTISMTWPQYLRNECTLNRHRITLHPAYMELVSTLLMRRGEAVSYDDLFDILWPDAADGGPDNPEGCIRKRLWKLRKKLPRVITTVRGYGLFIERAKIL